MNLIFSSVFEQDFAELVSRFASEGSPQTANRFEENTYDLISLLLKNPELGRQRKDLKPGRYPVLSHPGFDRYLLFTGFR